MLNVVSVVELVSVSQYLKWVTVRVLGKKVRYLLTHLRRWHVPDIVLGSNSWNFRHTVISFALIARKRYLLSWWVSYQRMYSCGHLWEWLGRFISAFVNFAGTQIPLWTSMVSVLLNNRHFITQDLTLNCWQFDLCNLVSVLTFLLGVEDAAEWCLVLEGPINRLLFAV